MTACWINISWMSFILTWLGESGDCIFEKSEKIVIKDKSLFSNLIFDDWFQTILDTFPVKNFSLMIECIL